MKWLALLAVAGCGTFEDPNVVIDLRVIAMVAEPPEQVIDVSMTTDPIALLQQVVPAQVCALVSDRDFDRDLRFRWTLCAPGTDDRCDLSAPYAVLDSGITPDPDQDPPPPLCTTIAPNGNLLGVVTDSLNNDPLNGLGGIYYGVVLQLGGADADPALDIYAEKALRLMPNIPADIQANHNPTLAGLVASDPDAAMTNAQPMALNACDAPGAQKLEVTPRQKVRLTPIEPAGVRETYVTPTIDGGERTFTETITYQWVIGDGTLSSGTSGGGRDAFGNLAPLFTDFTAPYAADLTGPENIPVWIVVRDERLGAAWYEACIHVTP
ncbi:MAG: hypothetical protein ABI467_16705 [Kofleriaceae bacterium]